MLGGDVVWEHDVAVMQEVVERSAQADPSYSDAVALFERLVSYPGHHAVAPGKSHT